MTTCGLPRGRGCGSCDSCGRPDGTYAAGPSERFFSWLTFWTIVIVLVLIVGGIASLFTGLPFFTCAGVVAAIPAITLFLVIAFVF